MDGLLVIDKPPGPTSHDVVARARRLLGEPRIGHTGTLDPIASGVLPLVVGRATRLARFLSGSAKRYDATIRLGMETDTYDSAGQSIGKPWSGPYPARDVIDRALDEFRGTFLQQPPAFSAKKIEGRRSYRLARAAARASPRTTPDMREPSLPVPVAVTTHAIDILGVEGDRVTIGVTCSAGFYVRALAHDLGKTLGMGAHLAALRRTRIGEIALDDAIPLEEAERNPQAVAARMIPMARLLLGLPAVVLTPRGAERTLHGCDLGPADALNGFAALGGSGGSGSPGFTCRLVDAEGSLLGIAEAATTIGLLHPSIVLM